MTAGLTVNLVVSPFRASSVRRYYDPQTGQFLTVDPLTEETEQPYAYADGDPVDLVDPLGLGIHIGIPGTNVGVNVPGPSGVYHAAEDLNPLSPNNPIRRWAASGAPGSGLLKYNPAYLAVSGYANEWEAYENGCSLWTVAKYGVEGAGGLALTGLTATSGAAFATGRALGDIAYQSPLVGPDSVLFGNSTLGQTARSGLLNPPGRGAWRLGWSVDARVSPAAPGFRLKAGGSYLWLVHASGF